MPSDAAGALDLGLLTPVAVGLDGLVSDEAVLTALVTAELGLVRAWAAVGGMPAGDAEAIAVAWGRDAEAGRAVVPGLDVAGIAAAAVSGGNPVIPLVPMLKAAVPGHLRTWVHRGATSQDIVDTALMLVARRAVDEVLRRLDEADEALVAFAAANRDVVGAGRTLAQHAVPTTVGLRAAGWLSGVRRAAARLRGLVLPAQLGGAAGTRASFAQIARDAGAPAGAADSLPAAFAAALGLDDAGVVWHTSRWPVTELADALTQTTDALGKLAGDVVTLARTEIAELSAGPGGGSSAMPQKSNPVTAVLICSAALRAPQLAATLHLAAALADDERPAGSWHGEWPALRELLRIALGASAHAARLAASLRVDRDAVAHNLGLTHGLVLAERLSLVLTPLVGAERVKELVAAAAGGGDLAALVEALPEAAGLDVPALLDPAQYLGEAGAVVDRLTASDVPPAPHPQEECP